jgi:putative ABC transport system permease protein
MDVIVTPIVTESLFLSLIGGVLALVLSLASIRTLVALAPPEIPRIGETSINLPILGFCLAITLFTGLLCGIIPALWVSKFDLGAYLKEGGTVSAGASIGLFSRFLVVFEIALSCVLLVGAGLPAHCFARVQMIKFSFQSDHVLTVELRPDPRLPDLRLHLRQIPEIEAVAGGSIPISMVRK